MGGIPVKELLSKAIVGVQKVPYRVLELQLAAGGSLVIFVVFYALQVRLSRLEGMRDDMMNFEAV